MVDPASQCGTTSPFATGTETISWSGACRDGRLHGAGVLVWFRDGELTERDEGTFVNGELHGAAVISYPDETTIQGHYRGGVRHGEFMLVLPDQTYVCSVYVDGRQISQERLDRRAIKAWRDARKAELRASAAQSTPRRPEATTAMPAPSASAPVAPAARTPAAAPQPAAPARRQFAEPAPSPGAASTGLAALAPREAPPPAPLTSRDVPPPAPLASREVPRMLPTLIPPPPAPVLTPPMAGSSGIRLKPSGRRGRIESIGLIPIAHRPVWPHPWLQSRRAAAMPAPILRLPAPTLHLPATTAGATRTRLVATSRAAALFSGAIALAALPAAGAPTVAQRPVIVAMPPPRTHAVDSPRQAASLARAPDLAPDPTGGVALNLDGADIRQAVKVILGDLLGQTYTIDPKVRGTVAMPPRTVAPSQLVALLRGLLRANGAGLTAEASGHRIYPLVPAAGLSAPAARLELAPTGGTEALFVEGYALERAGNAAAAARVYRRLAERDAASPIAAMARERLDVLASRQPAAAAAAPPPALGQVLCTRRGLYANRAKWCGLVRSTNQDRIQLEVLKVELNNALAVGFRAATCTGGRFISILARGTRIWLPAACLQAEW